MVNICHCCTHMKARRRTNTHTHVHTQTHTHTHIYSDADIIELRPIILIIKNF